MRYWLGLMFVFTFTAEAATVVWRIQSNKLADSIQYKLEQDFAAQVAKATNNTLVMIIKPEKKGYVGLREAYTATRLGEIQGFFMSPQYWGGADPVLTILGDLVGAWRDPNQYLRWLRDHGGIDYLSDAYARDGLKLVAYMVSPMESLVSRVPVGRLDDFSGQLMRTPPGMVTDYFNALGARARELTIAQVEPALRSGQISVADYSNVVVNEYVGLYRDNLYTNYPGFHSMPLLDFVVSQRAWSALTAPQRAALKAAAQRWQHSLDGVFRAELKETLLRLQQQGVKLQRWSPQELKKARNLAVKIWDRYAKKSEHASLLLTQLKRWLAKEGNITASR
ncbi:MAG: TRAP transporter substrate-binding protein DctP [Pseudomonadales bacterium]